jgi:rhodanese-related sulfurtransferase
MDTIDLDELLDRLGRPRPPRLLMTHDARRYDQAHIPASEPFDGFTDHPVVDPDVPIVLYCSGDLCGATFTAYRRLRHRGHRDVRILRGGLAAWASSGLPLAGSLVEQDAAVPA